jgi:Ca2+-transporting ATPase
MIATDAHEDAETKEGHSDTPWHFLRAADAAAHCAVDPCVGLSASEVATRQASRGLNRLPSQKPRSPWWLFARQFTSALILVLIGAAGLAASIGNVKDASVILAVVIINAFVGFYQEYRAEQSLAALRKMLSTRTHVRRDGDKIEVDAESLVPGDIVLIEAGDRVPADGRVVLAANLDIDESALTGESLPSAKQTDAMSAVDLPVADRSNMAYMNTMVTRGRGEMIVTATGGTTEMGRLAVQLAATREPPSPLQVQLDRLGKRLGLIAVFLVGLLFSLELLRGVDLADATIDAIALAVAAIPEGLPVVVTVTLALGMRQMARHRAIVKKLASVETLGSTTVICSDKTGTLTLNQMTARAFLFRGQRFEVSGEGYGAGGEVHARHATGSVHDLAPLMTAVVACNDSRVEHGQAIGDPTEAALLTLAAKAGYEHAAVLKSFPRVAEIPFDSAHKFMATFHVDGENIRAFVKGAPDILLAHCSSILASDGEKTLDDTALRQIDDEYRALAAEGLRGLLVATRTWRADELSTASDLLPEIADLTFIGLVGLMDPPRPEALEAIENCRSAGIAVKMITGDHRDTGVAIAHKLGLDGDALTGAELDTINAQVLAERIEDITVFARVAPQHKVQIVRALQSQGHVVAMTGDGVNDAPALRAADIGVAMGVTGTEVAKEAASMVLTDDNFSTIVNAVKQGRALYDNILKFVRFQMSTTVGAILTVFTAPLVGLPEPFNPIQILWVAMIMDGPPAVSLALDTARPGIMSDSPRPRGQSVLPAARLVRIIVYGITMMAGTLGVLYFALEHGDTENAMTLAFTTFVLFQFFNVFNARVEDGSAFNGEFFKNRMLWGSLGGVLGLQAVAVHWEPAQAIFQTSDLSATQWALAVSIASLILLFEEGRKLLVRLIDKARHGRFPL